MEPKILTLSTTVSTRSETKIQKITENGDQEHDLIELITWSELIKKLNLSVWQLFGDLKNFTCLE